MNGLRSYAEELNEQLEADFNTKDLDSDFIRESESLCIKCGDMYLKDNSELIFICTDCDERFDCVEAFKAHILVHYEVALQPVPSMESLLCNEAAAELEELTSHCFEDNSTTTSFEYNHPDRISSPFDYKQQNITSSSFNDYEETSRTAAPAVQSSDEEFASVDDADDLNDCSMATEEIEGQVVVPVFECDICKKTFSCQNSLRLHRRIHTVRPRFECDLCDMSYAHRTNLNIHRRRHTGEKPYACMYCKECFITSTLRNKHQNEHTGRKPYSCVKCKAKFATSMQLLNHDRNKHLDLRPFQCTACSKTFRQNAHLQAHYAAIHTDARQPKERCGFCSAVFKTKLLLGVHMKVHDGKRFKCRICQKIYYSYSSVQAHIKRHKKRRD